MVIPPHPQFSLQLSLKLPHANTRQAPIKPQSQPTSTKPSARALRLARVSGSIHPLLPSKVFRPNAAVSDSFISSKQDKRLIRHSAFVSRITSAPPWRVTKKTQKSIFTASKTASSKASNPSKASTCASKTSSLSKTSSRSRRKHTPLSASLASLADALPTPVDPPPLRSLVSKKGALRRKERLVRDEMYRFGASMARLNSSISASDPATTTPTSMLAVSESAPAPPRPGSLDLDQDENMDVCQKSAATQTQAQNNKWAALRGFISETMQHNPAFTC
ncbi:hypothetical protein CDD82_5762 [Ophiocordyceps australis]|uniref:Ribosome biogenesis protein SLX9 n=1 Tax=Ophiocordyceps australis TaxID=1399860 RepID=A0A2C5YWM5_9HYPO|nr:hypothetical protein CDD82_5762 [Ophiocordyceps australis]